VIGAGEIVTGVDFVAVPTNDLAAAVEFYGTTVGLKRSVYMPERNFAEFETLDTGVCHMAFFADPDGNALMLHHRYAPRVTNG
jgi:catechol 2,3-dioxygenase-like lactoylglutathione lyase family enzyme